MEVMPYVDILFGNETVSDTRTRDRASEMSIVSLVTFLPFVSVRQDTTES